MRTIEQIDADMSHERAALRHFRECEEAADAKGDESAFDAARKHADYHCQRIDAMARERSQARYALFAMVVDTGAFSARFQRVTDGNYYSVVDTREGREIESDIVFASAADARAKEMSHFAWQREQADKYHARPIDLSTRRR